MRANGGLGEKIRGLRSVARHALRTVRLVAGIDRALLVTAVLCEVVDAASLVAMAWIGKHLIDACVARDGRAALFFVVLELSAVCARAIASQVYAYAELALSTKVDVRVNTMILEKAARVAYARFEDADFIDEMTRARDEASYRVFSIVKQTLAFGRQGVTLIGFAVLIVPLGAWAILVLLVAALPPFVGQALHGRAFFELARTRTTRLRNAYYLQQTMTDQATAKEVKLFGLARWLTDRFVAVRSEVRQEEVSLAGRRARTMVLLAVLSTVVLYSTYAVVVLRAVRGDIMLGTMMLYIVVLRQGQSTLQGALNALATAYADNLFVSNLYEYLEVPEDDVDAALPFEDAIPDEQAETIEFRGVGFRYPGAERDTLVDINLTLTPGETVAIVGRNGAGKTTLIKLLAGLHRPTTGKIEIGGRDIAEFSSAELRRKVGVIFQDFARFQFTVADNVGAGWLPLREDAAAVRRAVDDAGASEIVARLPQQLATPLGKSLGGEELSVGEWQRIALARAFMRRSRVLILDEPTASMDPEVEHELFRRFRALKQNRTALLVTHRLSTVRMADRILVFDKGGIVESGTHDALLDVGGAYAALFRMQADAYGPRT